MKKDIVYKILNNQWGRLNDNQAYKGIPGTNKVVKNVWQEESVPTSPDDIK